jgi:hypothetical protein
VEGKGREFGQAWGHAGWRLICLRGWCPPQMLSGLLPAVSVFLTHRPKPEGYVPLPVPAVVPPTPLKGQPGSKPGTSAGPPPNRASISGAPQPGAEAGLPSEPSEVLPEPAPFRSGVLVSGWGQETGQGFMQWSGGAGVLLLRS